MHQRGLLTLSIVLLTMHTLILIDIDPPLDVVDTDPLFLHPVHPSSPRLYQHERLPVRGAFKCKFSTLVTQVSPPPIPVYRLGLLPSAFLRKIGQLRGSCQNHF